MGRPLRPAYHLINNTPNNVRNNAFLTANPENINYTKESIVCTRTYHVLRNPLPDSFGNILVICAYIVKVS